MADAPRPLTRQQLSAFIKDHQALRTMERMSQVSLVDTPADMADVSAAISSINAAIAVINAALVSVNALVAALTEVVDDNLDLTSTVDSRVNEAQALAVRMDDALLAPPAREPIETDNLLPPPVPLTAGTLVATLGSSLGANPTGAIGLTAVNGALNTFIRSDGAPALSQAIAPTWTALHTFTLSGSMASPSMLVSSASPFWVIDETDQAADEKRWGIGLSAKTMQRRSSTDNGSASIVWETVTRGTGTAISNIAWGDTTNNNSYTFGSTGPATFSGQILGASLRPTGSTVPANGIYLPAANTVGLAANGALTARYTGTTFETVMQTLFSGVTTPAQFTANQNDFAIGNVTVLRASTDASRDLTGIAGGVTGRFLLIINVGAQPLVIVNDATSTAANRFLLASGTNTTISAGGAALFWYDGTSSRWRNADRLV
jgi:hypothetical protein